MWRNRKARSSRRLRRSQPVTSSLHLLVLHERHVGTTDSPVNIGELNRRAEAWLARYAHAVVHRSTKVTPDERFRIEQPLLGRLPRVRFDTARREPRRVGGSR